MNMKSYPYLLWFALEFAGIMLIASGFGFELGQFGNQICLAIGALAYAVGATSKDFVLAILNAARQFHARLAEEHVMLPAFA